eukprot:IDg168t1
MIPVAFDNHWGVIVADKDCKIKWGDSLHQKVDSEKIRSAISVVQTIMGKLFSNASWTLSTSNLMEDMGYNRQQDGYSCGFYVICLVLSRSVRFGDLIPFSYRGASTPE